MLYLISYLEQALYSLILLTESISDTINSMIIGPLIAYIRSGLLRQLAAGRFARTLFGYPTTLSTTFYTSTLLWSLCLTDTLKLKSSPSSKCLRSGSTGPRIVLTTIALWSACVGRNPPYFHELSKSPPGVS